MSDAQGEDVAKARIMLGLLESVERDGARSQRRLAAELGIALGLVNVYLKRCVKKGLLKVQEAPARRYAYYLTPQGFAEKSRLTIEYLSSSFSFFRQARSDCVEALTAGRARGCHRVALLGISDLAEIATLCAKEAGVTIVAVVDEQSAASDFFGLPVVRSIGAIAADVDAVMVSDLVNSATTAEEAVRQLGEDRVHIPTLLRIRIANRREEAAE